MGTIFDTGRVTRMVAGAGFALLASGTAVAQVTSILSLDWNGQLPNEDAYDPAISFDGRHVAFQWYDSFTDADLFLRDRVTGVFERISVNSNEVDGDSYSYGPALTPDLRYVAFSSYATNLVPGDTNGPYPAGHDVFVRDRQSGTTERVSIGALGAQGSEPSYSASISADGRYVAFISFSNNFVVGDTNGEDVFVRDRVNGTTERVNVDSNGSQADAACTYPSISADGRYVAFYGGASNLVAGDTNGAVDVFVRDRSNGTTVRVSVATGGAQGNAGSDSGVISGDGRYVVFRSSASNLVPGDTNAKADVFLHDLQTATTERISVASIGTEGNGDSSRPALTPDARYVVFQSLAANLVPGDTNARADIFVRDRQLGSTQRVSLGTNGAQGSFDSGIQGASISADGRYVAFDSRAQLVAADTNTWHDVYVRDRRYSPLELACVPGVDGVIACPCSNPPSGPGRGCDNGAGTGGAMLTATGVAELSTDSLVLTTSGEGPSAMSIVIQGDASLTSGAAFGHAVRCVDGSLRRMYVRPASAGSITAPNFGLGDPSISTRSAALGDAIQAGQTRWYFVYYRDPAALGACSPSSTFNATPAGLVVWHP